jgi:molecular chaperone GrpE
MEQKSQPNAADADLLPAANENAEQESTAAAAAISTAQDPLENLQAEVAKLRDQWVRAVAETENVRKRGERDREETSKYAITAFAREMVSVLENLKRASEHIPEEVRSDALLGKFAEGIDLTLKELLAIFERHHIRRIDPMGEKFDHNYHQAVVQVERPDLPSGTVVQVVQAGYVIHDRLLRPAMVAVSKQGEPVKQVDTTA